MGFSNPKKNIDQFGIAEGMRVADLGAGSGFYSIAAARKVGPEGIVYAVDIQKDLLERIRQEAVSEELDNVEIVWGDIAKPQGTTIGDNAVDVAIISNVLFQVEDIQAVCAEAYRIVRSGGRVLVIDWRDSFAGLGPAPDHIVAEQQTHDALQNAGFLVTGEIDAGDHHYGIVARKEK